MEDGSFFLKLNTGVTIGYITPKDKLAGRENEIFAKRRRKLEQARENRRRSRQQMCEEMVAVGGENYLLPEEALTATTNCFVCAICGLLFGDRGGGRVVAV